jgi:hypothetical protein
MRTLRTRLGAALSRASDHDLGDAGADPVRRGRKLAAVVGAVAFSTLLLEVLLTRMYPFFLEDVSSLLAEPGYALLVLAALASRWRAGDGG